MERLGVPATFALNSRALARSVGIPILAVFTAVIVGSVFMLLNDYDPIAAYGGLIDGALGSPRAKGFDVQPHAMATTPVGVAHDVRAAVSCLRDRGVEGRSVFTLGFCFGGAYSWLQAAAGHGLAGAIGFYGKPVDFRIGKDGGSPIALEAPPPASPPPPMATAAPPPAATRANPPQSSQLGPSF